MKPKGYVGQLIEPIKFDVRTKLLVMLVVLSLPLLIISLLQLRTYQQSHSEQTHLTALIRAAAAISAVESWLKDHTEQSRNANISPDSARDLYERLTRYVPPGIDSAIMVFDARGRAIEPPAPAPRLALQNKASLNLGQQKWSDGILRETSLAPVEPYGWTIAVGMPLPENTPTGRSILMLTLTWAFALIASSLLSIWAVGRFTKPLRKLAASASTLGEGKFQERVAVETDDEVGTLAYNFNSMATSLQAKFDELRTQGAFIEEVLNSLPLGVVVLDSKLTVTKINSTFAEFVGEHPDSFAGRNLYEAASGLRSLRDVIDDVRQMRRAFVNYSVPLEFAARKDETDEPKYWDVILWPITEQSVGSGELFLIISEVSKRVRAEKLATSAFAAEKSRAAELESIINQMHEGVVIVDARGRYRVNVSAARILGRKPGEFRDGVQALIEDMALHDLKRNRLAESETPIGRALERGESVFGEHVVIYHGKDERVLEVSATPLVNETNSKSEGVVAVFRDITEEVRQHNELVEAYSRLREHDRLKSAFVANISHELRTPLNVIIGLCQLLGRDRKQPLAPLHKDAITRMERNARSLLDLVNDLLDYSQLEAGRAALHIESVDIKAVIAEVVQSHKQEAKDKNLNLRFEVQNDLEQVLTDRQKIVQLLSNLLSNAIKFTPAGEVLVSASVADDEHWLIEVRDTGIGMSSDALTYIFDRFRQVDDRLTRTYSGVGLGLAITRKIVELLEGEITVESRKNKGSSFRIKLPRVARPLSDSGPLLKETDARINKEVELPVKSAPRLHAGAG